MNLVSDRYNVTADIASYTQFASEQGWGDGLPLIPPTPELVEEYVVASGMEPGAVVAALPPLLADCTVEKVAINAVMSGAPASAMSLIIATIKAVSQSDFALDELNVTTAPVVPVAVVNGPARNSLQIPFGPGCLGGADGNGASVGRAIRLVMRNVAGQRVGVTSKSVHGQPGRVSGILFGEWEERSPWPPLAYRRGASGNAVTVFATMGTMNVIDRLVSGPAVYLDFVGKSIAVQGANGYAYGGAKSLVSEMLIVMNPVFAEVVSRDFPDIEEVQDRIWKSAAIALDEWDPSYHDKFVSGGLVDERGRVPLMSEPGHVMVAVSGGLGGLHAVAMHGYGPSLAQTVEF